MAVPRDPFDWRFPPGTGADVLVRFYSNKLQQRAGRPVVVESKVGAFGNIASEYVARSKPDGYTIYIAPGSSNLAAAPSLFKKLPFDPVHDFEHVTTLARLPFLLVVASGSPHKNVTELADYLKSQGDKSSYGSIGNTGIVGSELFKAQFGLQTVEVKYKNVADCLNDLIGGNIAFAHVDPTGGAAQIKANRIRALATTGGSRTQALPDIPSAKEAGILNCNLFAWWSVHMPKGTPKPILEQLERWFNELTADQDTVTFLKNAGADPFVGSSASLKSLLEIEIKVWADYVKIAKIEPIS